MSGQGDDNVQTTGSADDSSEATTQSGGRPAAISTGELGSTLRSSIPCPRRNDRPVDRDNSWPQGILDEHGRADSNRMVRSLQNGCYQHLMFLGVGGFVICNHCDNEILLIDPWTSHHSQWTELVPGQDARPLSPRSDEQQVVSLASAAKWRLARLASFLRCSASEDGGAYKLIGILLSHMHFDHAEDIPILLELLAADLENPREASLHTRFDPATRAIRYSQDVVGTVTEGSYTDHRGRVFHLRGPKIREAGLPKIYCDYDSMFYLLTYGFYMDYTQFTIDGNDVINQGERQRWGVQGGQWRYWYGNEALLDELNRRRRAAARPDGTPNPEHFTNRNTPAWEAVKRVYAVPPPGTPNNLEVDRGNWYEITAGATRLHYDDSFNETLSDLDRCVAGHMGGDFYAGNYHITPYVWDHSNTGCCLFGAKTQRAQDEQTAGSLQRCSAFMIARKDIEGAKRTFFLGSGGEMSRRWTRQFIQPNIETDLLIQAILPRWLGLATLVASFRRQIWWYLDYMVRHITVKEAVVFVHFEDFISGVPSSEDYATAFDNAVPWQFRILRRKLRRASRRQRRRSRNEQGEMEENEDEAEEDENNAAENEGDANQDETTQTGTSQAESDKEGMQDRVNYYNKLLDKNRFYAMQRRGFDVPFPFDAGHFMHGIYSTNPV